MRAKKFAPIAKEAQASKTAHAKIVQEKEKADSLAEDSSVESRFQNRKRGPISQPATAIP